MKAFVTYLKHQSPSPQLPSHSNGWIELQNGQRWNPSHVYKFNASTERPSLVRRLLKFWGGVHAF
ncbi:phage filamentation protein Fil family protein [Phytobacter diazotrophicus]|uniref:phage filamentation protein Fil family protein n=1 Tax=Phytobacter diazotrophicus TaxID=395631 RepID=UPI0030763314